jgi:hypothetical protein
MKDCVRFAPMIGAREGELAPAEAAALQAHLSLCAACAARARDLAATEGLVREALLARANARDFAPFVDEVMARVPAGRPVASRPRPARGARAPRGVWGWVSGHRRAAAAALAPVLAALALLVYVRVDDGGRGGEIALLEVYSVGEATTILKTSYGPVVLLSEENGS